MGKQINYYMEYESFVCIVKKAIELGCEIIKSDKTGEIIRDYSVNIVTKEDKRYFFHIPEAGDVKIKKINGKRHIDNGYSASGSTLIEAGYSFISLEEKKISSARLFCISDYYDDKGNLVKRPECVTKIYNALARYVKKISPYTELTDTAISTKEENYLQACEYKHKEYITDYCLKLRELGYKLR